ncbi:hypothetical protein [Pseudothauera rhizosphaerae]|uniref:Uncharacterized protein n=1 Tax=Pseudothauera rhizosphaerae TaxID=2565932 RepID=A0A4S4AMF6_9RHOO|nr:hypothetical protein [Pseudothauera rhizosphaerae]THF60338.1 hypothetical protein E6O51_14110 [Pseudothauera rhizosphaerae]
MSEYQYYEFAAIDRPLSHAEMTELRAVSSRAQISPSGFVNHYEWGDLKADPADWMRRHFDTLVYTSCWCSCRLALRVPRDAFCRVELEAFAVRHVLDFDKTSAHWIVHWSLYESENYDRFGMDNGSGWMQRLLPLRDELLRGDLRPLYLGWLAGAGELSGDEAEPEVPAGLSALSPAQQALAEFLEIDSDMLAAAAAGSAPMPQTTEGDDGCLDVWLETWPREAMLDVLKLLAQGRGQEAERHVRGRHAAWLKALRLPAEPGARRRSVAELSELAESLALVRQEHEAQESAKEEAKRRREREEELQRLMAEVDQRWEAIDAQARRGTALGYEYAVRALTDLAEAYVLTSTPKEFECALRRFLVPHAKRGALLRRLTAAGLWSG